MNAAHAPAHLDLHVQWMTAAGMTYHTVTDRQGILCRINHDLDTGIERATAEQIAAWLAQPGWSATTRSVYFTHIWGYMSWMVLTGKRPDNPMITLRRVRVPRRLPRPVTVDVLHDVLARARDPWRTCVILAAYAGLRCCEIASIHREDITPRTLTVVGKGGRRATVPTHPAVWLAVKDLPDGLVIEAVGGRADAERVSVGAAGYFRRRLLLPGVSLHRFRHLFGTRVFQATRDLLVTRDALRHSSVQTTQGYAELEDEAVGRAVGQLPMPDLPGNTIEGRAGKLTPLNPDRPAA